MTTTPSIGTVSSRTRMASTAAPSAASFSPLPTQRPAAMAAASVTRTSSRAKFRSGLAPERTSCEITPIGPGAYGSDRAGRLAGLLRRALQRAGEAHAGDDDRRDQRNPVPVVEADPEFQALVRRRLVDDPVVGDQDRAREA